MSLGLTFELTMKGPLAAPGGVTGECVYGFTNTVYCLYSMPNNSWNVSNREGEGREGGREIGSRMGVMSADHTYMNPEPSQHKCWLNFHTFMFILPSQTVQNASTWRRA